MVDLKDTAEEASFRAEVRAWIEAVRQVPRNVSFELLECPPSVVDQLNMVAGEIKRPEWTIPRALTLGILIVIAIYLGANAVYVHVLGRDGLAASAAVAADTANRLVGPTGGNLITIEVQDINARGDFIASAQTTVYAGTPYPAP